MALGDLAVSTGSACSSGSQAPSHVLVAIGAVGEQAGASIRFGLGRRTTDADIDFAIDRVTTVVKSLRRAMANQRGPALASELGRECPASSRTHLQPEFSSCH